MSCYSATVSQGTWGALPAPSLSTVVAAPNGGQAGIGVNDELTVTWSISTVLNNHCCCWTVLYCNVLWLHPVLMRNTKPPCQLYDHSPEQDGVDNHDQNPN